MQVLSFRGHDVLVRRIPYRKTIGVTLHLSGVIRVSVPKSTTVTYIKNFLDANGEWIDTHLKAYNEVRRHHPPKRYVDGETYPLMGEVATLVYEPGTGSCSSCKIEGRSVIVKIPAADWPEFEKERHHPEMQDLVVGAFKKLGKEVLRKRLHYFSYLMDLVPAKVAFRAQKTRWGSCTFKKVISLNWRLIFAPPDTIDYVIIHELSHLKHYNHSEEFWRLVAGYAPNYKAHRKYLRDHQYDADFLARKSELYSW